MGNDPINKFDADGGKSDDWYLPAGAGRDYSQAVWFEGSGHRDGYTRLGGDGFTFPGWKIPEVLVTASRQIPLYKRITDLPGFYNFNAVPSGAYGPWRPKAIGMSVNANLAGFSTGVSFAWDEQNNFGLYFSTTGGPGYTYFEDSKLKGVFGIGVTLDVYENNSREPVLNGIAGGSYDFSAGYEVMGGYSRPISPETGRITNEGVHRLSIGLGTGFRASRSNTTRLW